VFADHYPYMASATGLTAALVPRWAQAGGRDSLVARIQDPDTRARIRQAMVPNLERRGGADRLQFRSYDPDSTIEGRTLAEVATDRGEDPLTTALDLIEEGSPGVVSFNMLASDVERFMRQPWTMTSSDGGLGPMGEGVPHPRNYGAFPRKLRKYVRETETVDLGFAVRSMTQLPASVFGMDDRGRLQPGARADLVVLDLAAVDDPATFQSPHQLSEGVRHVIVNGTLARHDDAATGARPGRVLSR
jgi:N-acyl-D-aspartate/D-glutamate deacylase